MAKLRYLEITLRIKIACTIKARADEIQGLLATTSSRNFCLLLCNLKLMDVKIISHIMEEHRLHVFENRMLGKISGPKEEEVTGGWKKPA